MTDTSTTVTLNRSEWRRVLTCMERGITMLDDYPHVQDARWGLYDRIEEQVDEQYDGEPETLNRNDVSFSSADHSEGTSQTLDDVLRQLEDEFDMSRSLHAEELGRKNAQLRD